MDSEVEAILPIQAKFVTQKLLKIEIQLQSNIQDLRNCTGTRKDIDIDQLNFAARKLIHEIKTSIDELEGVSEEEDPGNIRDCINEVISKHKTTLVSLQVSLRKANLIAEKQLTSVERQELFSDKHEEENDVSIRKRLRNKNEAAKQASNITQNLLRIAEMMNTQVEQSSLSAQRLEESSNQLTDVKEEYKGLSGVIQAGKNLINKYNRRELTDTLLIFFGLVLFFSTVIYIVLKRI